MTTFIFLRSFSTPDHINLFFHFGVQQKKKKPCQGKMYYPEISCRAVTQYKNQFGEAGPLFRDKL